MGEVPRLSGRVMAAHQTPVEALEGPQLVLGAAAVVDDVLALTYAHRGEIDWTPGAASPDTERVLDVIANFPDRLDHAARRAEQLGHPLDAERHAAVMVAYVADIADQPSRFAADNLEMPPMSLLPRPDFVHQMGPDTVSMYDAELEQTFYRSTKAIASKIVERFPVTSLDSAALLELAGDLANEMLRSRETGAQFGIDITTQEYEQQLDALRMLDRERRPGSY